MHEKKADGDCKTLCKIIWFAPFILWLQVVGATMMGNECALYAYLYIKDKPRNIFQAKM